MTKVYDALRRAEQERLTLVAEKAEGAEATPSPSASPSAIPSGADEIGRMREILFGNIIDSLDSALDRLEKRVAEQSEAVRGNLGDIEERLGKRLMELEDRARQGQSDLRQHWELDSKALKDSIREGSAQAIEFAETKLAALDEAKLASIDLGTLFAGAAAKLGVGSVNGSANDGDQGAKA